MASNKGIPGWLTARLRDHRFSLRAAYQFGSSLNPASRPNDIDLVLVSADGAGEPAWRATLALADELRSAFPLVFQTPLSVMVVTPSEWGELNGVIVRERRSLLE